MAPNACSAPAIKCAEDIVLVHLLHPVISRPFDNQVNEALVRRQGYTLPFDREQRLANTLAFLSSTKHDPKHVSAVCVTEDAESESLNVLLAINKATPQDGSRNLQQLKKNFEDIFQALSQIQVAGARVQNDVFAAIVAMCRARILCRLGFIANSRDVVNQPIKVMLQETIKSLNLLDKSKRYPKTQLPSYKTFVHRAKEVVKTVDMWTKHQTVTRLGDLVAAVRNLSHVEDVQSILADIPNTSMDPSLRKRLFNVINKVSRYKDASRFLYRTAKKFPLARHMKVVLVSLPPEAFQRPADASQYEPSLLRTLSRFPSTHEQRDLELICRLLETNIQSASKHFAQRSKETVTEAKIHAEIQLLYHFEIEPSTQPPRVVCSSKDACYICNYFILMHGKMHMPRCHGKIYPGWRLPSLSAFQNLETGFDVKLEALVRDSLDNLLKRKRVVYPDPNESTLLTLPHSMSTVVSVARPVVEKTPVMPVLPVEEAGTGSSSSQSSSSPVTILSENTPTVESQCQSLQSITQPRSVSSAKSASTSSDSSFDPYIELSQGNVVSGSNKSKTIPPFYTAGPLELVIEHLTEPAHGERDQTQNKFSYSIEWLGGSEIDRLKRLETPTVIDAESLEGEVTYSVEQSFYVTGRGSVVKVLIL